MTAAQRIRKILVGISPDPRSDQALLQAATLASRLGAELRLVHALDEPAPPPKGAGDEGLEARRADTLRRARSQLLGHLNGVLRDLVVDWDVEERLALGFGHPAKVLLDHARDRADLIVIGPHAKRKMLDFGSTARGILSSSNVPIWTQAQPVGPIERILVPIDFSDHSRRAMEYARELAIGFGARLQIMYSDALPYFGAAGPGDLAGPDYVVENEIQLATEQLEELVRDFDWGRASAEPLFLQGEPAEAVLDASEGAHLIVMGTHGRTGLSRFLLGSVADAVLKRAQQPVLAVPSPSRSWVLDGDQA